MRALVAFIFTTAVVVPVSAQSLGDVARREGARRQSASTGRVYTHDSLRPEPPAAPASSATPPPPPAGGVPVPASEPQAQAQGKAEAPAASQPDQKKDEKHWRGRIAEAREGLARAQMFDEALQSRINGLTTDFLSRDDPAQRRVIGMDRRKAAAERERVTKEIAQFKKSLAEIEEEAHRAGVPPGWLR